MQVGANHVGRSSEGGAWARVARGLRRSGSWANGPQAHGLVLITLPCLLALAQPTGAAASGGEERPNVLVILAEDLGTELACYGDAFAHTPHLDRLAKGGLLYTNAYAVSSSAPVSRAALLSGLYPTSIGAHCPDSPGQLPVGMDSLSARLQTAGYWCALAGELDDNLSGLETAWDASGEAAHWRDCPEQRPFFCLMPLQVGDPDLEDDAQSEAIEHFGHEPARAVLRDHWPDQPDVRQWVARHADLVSALDARVGAILAELHASKHAAQTLVIFCGSNGVGLWRGKQHLYDVGLHIPFILRMPSSAPHLSPASEGQAVERLISLVDVVPTLYSLLGLDIERAAHGRPFLGQASAPARLYVHGSIDRIGGRQAYSRWVRSKRFAYLRNAVSTPLELEWAPSPALQAVRRAWAASQMSKAGARALRLVRPAEELYDCEEDPDQLHDLARDPRYRKLLERLRAAHLQWAERTMDLAVLPAAALQRASAGGNVWEWARATSTTVPWSELRSAAGRARSAHPSELSQDLIAEQPGLRYWALVGLRRDPKVVDSKREFLLPLLRDPSAGVRLTTAGMLIEVDSAGEAASADSHKARALRTLKKGLVHTEAVVRIRALVEVHRLGKKVLELQARLQRMALKDPDARVARLAASALAILAEEGQPEGNPEGDGQVASPLDARGRPSPPAESMASLPTIIVDAKSVKILATGRVIKEPRFPLAQALRLSQPGDIIGIKGAVGRVGFGGSDPGKQWVAMHAGGKPVTGITIIGLDPDRGARIAGAYFDERYGRPTDLRFQNLTFENPRDSFAPFLTAQNNIIGRLQCYDCDFRPSPAAMGTFGGKGMKWGMRLHGPAQADLRRCRFWPAQEHSIYADNLQGDSYFIDVEGSGNGRTGIQIVNRPASGPTGHGDVWIERCRFKDIHGQGGSDFTIAGHLGRVFIVDCESLGAASGSQGALTIWSPNNPKQGGRYLDEAGFATTELWLENFHAIHPKADRSHISIAGVARVTITGDFQLKGNRVGIELDPDKDIDNGHVYLDLGEHPSEAPGWKTRTKLRHQGRTLKATEIDALTEESAEGRDPKAEGGK